MSENKFSGPEALARCVPMSRLQSVLSGKWKILILWYVAFYKVQRFGQLLRRLDGVTQSTLTRQLRELEADGFLRRQVYPEVPLRVEYTLTEQGASFLPVLEAMLRWSEANLCPPGYVSPYGEELNLREPEDGTDPAAHR
nr:helix-turn-helix domain-containing protein [uncultured Oscillibacter sp.]